MAEMRFAMSSWRAAMFYASTSVGRAAVGGTSPTKIHGKEARAFLAVVLIEPPLPSASIGRLCYIESRTTKREARKVDITAGGG